MQISREYLKNNGAPENLFTYSLGWGTSLHCFKLDDTAKALLKDSGVTSSYDMTYNYVYLGNETELIVESDFFGTEPPVVDNTDIGDTDNTADTSNTVENTGCNATLTFAPIVFMTTLAGAAVVIKKKKD